VRAVAASADSDMVMTTAESYHIPFAIYSGTIIAQGTRWRSWLRHYAARQKVAGSNPDEFIGFCNLLNPSSRTMGLGSTQPLAEMSTMNLPGGTGRPARKADNLTAICEPIV
jgi:hypothetical protein